MNKRSGAKLLWHAMLLGWGWGMGLGLVETVYVFLHDVQQATLIPRLETAVFVLVLYGALVAVGFLLLALVLMGILRLLRRLTAEMLSLWLPATAAGGLIALRYAVPRLLGLSSGSERGMAAVASLVAALLLTGVAVLAVMLLVSAGRRLLARADWLKRWAVPAALVVYGVLVVVLLGMGLNRNVLWRLRRGPAGVARAASEKPNIVLLTIDALRADSLGAYGYEKDTSPHIDALARRGVLFEQAISQAPWTYPSFTSMMTSHYPTELDQARNELRECWLDERWVTLAEALHDAGYTTQAILTNVWLRKELGFAQGFDGFQQVDLPLGWDIILLREAIWGRVPLPVGEWLRAVREWVLGPPGRLWDTDSKTVNYHVVRWLYRNRKEPFFLWVHYIDPHDPYDPPPHLMPHDLNVSAERLLSLRRSRLGFVNARMYPEDVKALRALYDAEIRGQDEAIGEIMETLDRLGLSDRTVVVLSADHGEEFMEHGGFLHGFTLYDEMLHVPLIMAGPPLGEVRPVVKSQVSMVDLMPTLLEIAGADAPPGMRGQSLLSLMRSQGEEPPSRPAFSEGVRELPDRHAIRYQGFKVIHQPYQDQYEVYNLTADPGEQINLVSQPPEVVESLRSMLTAWEEEVVAVAEKVREEIKAAGRVHHPVWGHRLDIGGGY